MTVDVTDGLCCREPVHGIAGMQALQTIDKI